MIKQRVYVELDALLDTRIATVSKLNEDAAVELLTSPSYFNRITDDFESVGIDKQAYTQAYAKRSIETLRSSRLTKIPLILKELVSKMEQMSIDTPFVESVGVDLNVWPYQLSAEERREFATVVSAFAGVETIVTPIYRSPAELSPSFVRSNYTGMIIYNFRDFIEAHLKTIAQIASPSMTILAPAIFHGGVPNPDDYLSEDMSPDVNPFALGEMAFMGIFSLSLLQADNFSIFRPDLAA